MNYYFYSLSLILLTSILITLLPFIINSSKLLTANQIPQNNSKVAGIQKFNIPPISKNIQAPVVSARSVLVKDLATNTVLYQKDAGIRVPIASVTKVMTALLGSEYFKANQTLTIGESAKAAGSRTGLIKGEILTFRSLLYAMLLNSGNDAAFAVAENYPGGVLGFVSAMNKKVGALNLYNTRFDNPAGFDSPGHYSSAYDIAIITQEALKNYQLAKIVATKDTEILSIDKKYKHPLRNLNVLLSKVSGVMGVKTGYTDAAKENLVTLVEREGHQLLFVVLGSNDRFGESTSLIEWSYRNFTWADFGTVR